MSRIWILVVACGVVSSDPCSNCSAAGWLEQLSRSIDRLTQSVNSRDQLCNQQPLSHLPAKMEQLQTEVLMLKNSVARIMTQGFGATPAPTVFFSMATTKRFDCYNCIITFDVVHANTHDHAFLNGIFTAPVSGHYLFQFHALAESGKEVRLQMVINGQPMLFLYDRDIAGDNQRFSMLGQSLIHRLNLGDTMFVRLHDGAIKGGGAFAFTSLVGMLVARTSTGDSSGPPSGSGL